MKVLTAMSELQAEQCGPCQCLSLNEIVNHIMKSYVFDGDLATQVHISLLRTTHRGFTERLKRNQYRLVGPFAKVALANPSSRERYTQIRKLQTIFYTGKGTAKRVTRSSEKSITNFCESESSVEPEYDDDSGCYCKQETVAPCVTNKKAKCLKRKQPSCPRRRRRRYKRKCKTKCP